MSFYDLVSPEIKKVESYISSVLEPQMKEVYGMLLPYILRGGKRMRPILAVLCCKAAGGDTDKIIKPSGIIEMFHNFTLIHDDIADDSKFRRGEPTLHISHGIPIALNSGDALYTLLWKELVNLDMEQGDLRWLEQRYAKTFKDVAEGQGIELAWEREKRFDISEQSYLSMISGKTSSLLGLSCETGAFIGGADEDMRTRMRHFGIKIGAAFQIQDDILNVTGDFSKYKKEIGGDITEGKRTLMVIDCLKKSAKSDADRIMKILQSHSARKEDIDYVIKCFEGSGSIEFARNKASALVQEAKDQIAGLEDSDELRALYGVCDYILSRET